MVAGGRQCASRSTTTPTTACSAGLYRHIKRRVVHSFKRAYCKRSLDRKQAAYKLFGTKSSLLSSERVPRPLPRQDSSCSNRHHKVSYINKEGGMRSGPFCPTVENLDLVFQETSDSKSPTHSRPTEHGSRQAVQARPDHPNRIISTFRGLPDNMQQVARARNRPFCHEVQQQVTFFCVTGTRSPGFSSGCTQSAMGGSGCICLPTSSHLGQSGREVAGLPRQENDSDCSRVAQHDLVWGSSGYVQPNPTVSVQPVKLNTVLQSNPSQKSDQSKSPCMAPRASAIKNQGFSEAVAARIEAPQRGSTRSVYEAKWTIFTKVVPH